MEKQKYIHIADDGTMTIGNTDPVTFDDFIEPDSQIRSEHLVSDCPKQELVGVDNTGDRKSHLHKLPYQNVEKVTCDSIARVSQYGFNKYGCYDSWQLQDDIDVYYGALLRHIYADMDGEIYDSESDLAHLDHAIWNLQAILWLREKKMMCRENQEDSFYNALRDDVDDLFNNEPTFSFETILSKEFDWDKVDDLLYGIDDCIEQDSVDKIEIVEPDFMGNKTGELSD